MSDDERVEYASEVLRDEMPSLEEAMACEDCRSVRRFAVNDACTVCGSKSVFNLAALLSGFDITALLAAKRKERE